MRVLFVLSGNRGVSPVVQNQGESLSSQGVCIEYYFIKGKGFCGYLSNVRDLWNYLHRNKFDIVHAHYSLTAFVASLALAKPLVVSLMGSDVKQGAVYRVLIRLFALLFSWKAIIVKSEDMKAAVKIKKAIVIPNGVDLQRFTELDQRDCQEKLAWNEDVKHILFPANIIRPEKNYSLLEQSFTQLVDYNYELHWFNKVPNEETPCWYNAADVVVMTSLWEGSPNAIKEAMACNRPIVSTNVGDVPWLFGQTEGCYITNYSPIDCANKIRMALEFKQKTSGRQRVIGLGLDSRLVAQQLIKIYKRQLAEKRMV